MLKSVLRRGKNSIAGIVASIIAALPLSLVLKLGHALGSLLFLTNNRSKRVAQINLQLCFPNASKQFISSLLKSSLQQSSKTMLEALWLWQHGPYAASQLSGEVTNKHLVLTKKNSKKSTIFVTPHFGSWEFAGLYLAQHIEVMSLYVTTKLAAIDARSRAGRASTGAILQEVSQGDLKNLILHVKNGGNIGILPDQVPADNAGEFAMFYQRQAFTSTLIAKLANKYNCEVVLCYVLRNDKAAPRYDVNYISAPKEIYNSDLAVATRALNQSIEEMIQVAPENYLWSYKRFKIPAPGDEYPY